MKHRKSNRIETERRKFLKTVAGAGLANGLLGSSALATGMMLGRTAAAQNTGGVDKVIFVYVPGGSPYRNGKSLFTPNNDLVLNTASAALESVKNECVFFSNAKVSGGGGHGNTNKTLGGSGRANTYDVELERTLGANTPFPLLLLGVESNVGNKGHATKKDRRDITYQDNPIAAYNRVFSGATPSASVPLASQRALSVLDVQRQEITALRAALDATEKERLDEHLNSLEKLESRLSQSDAGGACSEPVFNVDGFRYNPSDARSFTAISELQADLAVLAMRCNLTKVVSIMLGNHQSQHVVPEVDYNDNYHSSIHGHRRFIHHAKTRNYLSSRITYLIDKLRTTTDAVGNRMLDSTLVVQVTDMADGHQHSTDGAPMLLAGGGSAINRGQLTQCGPHNNIFDTVTEVLGLSGQVPRFGNGPLGSVIA